MTRLRLGCLLISLTFAGCSKEKSTHPWTHSGEELTHGSTVVSSDFSTDFAVHYTIVVTTEARTQSALTEVSRNIIDQLPPHELVLIFFYKNAEEAVDEREYTVGRAWWGRKYHTIDLKPGDYSQHELRITLAEEFAEPAAAAIEP